MDSVLILGIAGGSGSGKTTLAESLCDCFSDKVTLVRHDDYYRAQDELSLEERARVNYDHPDAFETSLLVQHLKALKAGRDAECPVYDFTVFNRTDRTKRLVARPVIIVEGILIFADAALRRLFDICVYVDADADVRLARRILRDVKERGRTVESVVEQYFATVKPMHDLFVEPSRKRADIIVPEGGMNPVAREMLKDRLSRHISDVQIPTSFRSS